MASSDFRVISSSATTGLSRYRLIDVRENEIQSVNQFLDSIALRGLSDQTLRTYAHALLSLWRWKSQVAFSTHLLTEAHLADYVRHLRETAGEKKPPAPRTINLHLVVARSFYRFHMNCEVPRAARAPVEKIPHLVQSSRVGVCASRRLGRSSFHVKVPMHLVVPLKRDEVICFFESFRTFRDLSLVSLMLFCGLRSREVLSLRLEDVSLSEEELRVHGKGDKDRVLPLAPYVRRSLSSYLDLERPVTKHGILFVSLKGSVRGNPMTPAGLRELFRYHRKRSGIEKANPHRFRHTFAVDMVREGMPLPVLKRLLGHTSIEMTMRYVNLSAEDVRKEFERAVGRIARGAENEGLFPETP